MNANQSQTKRKIELNLKIIIKKLLQNYIGNKNEKRTLKENSQIFPESKSFPDRNSFPMLQRVRSGLFRILSNISHRYFYYKHLKRFLLSWSKFIKLCDLLTENRFISIFESQIWCQGKRFHISLTNFRNVHLICFRFFSLSRTKNSTVG